MYIRQIYTGCISEAAYYIESNGEAAVIDPLRDPSPYLELSESRGARIRYIFESHFHADFVSGHVELSEKSGAEIVLGPTDIQTGYPAIIARDGQVFRLGEVNLQLIHTPGHTLESSCLLLSDEHGKPSALFTGDTLFIGDVGRPDLAQKIKADLNPEKLASLLFDSLRNKIMPLPDDLVVYPAHGAGSACGKNLSSETSATLGDQKHTNYALNKDLSREQFIQVVLDGLTQPPSYFPQDVLLNIKGSRSVESILENLRGLEPKAFRAELEKGKALLIDTRSAEVFGEGFIPQAINLGIDGSFAVWAGTLIPDLQQPLLIVCEPGREKEVAGRLARVGLDQVRGFLKGGFEIWKQLGWPVVQIRSVSADELAAIRMGPDDQLLDVRRQSEYESEHVLNARNIPLDYIRENEFPLSKDTRYFVYCAGGYRSMVFASILKSRGFEKVVNISGGIAALKKAGSVKMSAYVPPLTML